MPKRCVAFGCGNTNRNGVSLFGFPKNSEFRKKWADQVKKTRGRWEGPTAYSHLCSCHFEQDCFEVTGLLSESFGLGKKVPKLKPDAVPTIFVRLLKREAEPADMVDQSQPKKGRSTHDKRARLMVLVDALASAAVTSTIQACHPEDAHPIYVSLSAPQHLQVPRKSYRTMKVQAHLITKTTGAQTEAVSSRDCAVQCSLISTPSPHLSD